MPPAIAASDPAIAPAKFGRYNPGKIEIGPDADKGDIGLEKAEIEQNATSSFVINLISIMPQGQSTNLRRLLRQGKILLFNCRSNVV